MIIEIATLPPAMQAWVKTLPTQGEIHFTKENDNLIIQEPLFDIERMKQALKGCESKEEALKNGLMLPQGKNETELLAWLDENIPKHLASKGLV